MTFVVIDAFPKRGENGAAVVASGATIKYNHIGDIIQGASIWSYAASARRWLINLEPNNPRIQNSTSLTTVARGMFHLSQGDKGRTRAIFVVDYEKADLCRLRFKLASGGGWTNFDNGPNAGRVQFQANYTFGVAGGLYIVEVQIQAPSGGGALLYGVAGFERVMQAADL
jgi:hypothetical protein